MQVQLEGITRLGKNRIKEHGDVWEIVGNINGDTPTRDGHKLLKAVNSKKDPDYLKWGPDPDFKVVKEIPDKAH